MNHPNTDWSEEQIQHSLQEVLRRASADADFRQLCLTSPQAAVKAATGRDLPEGFDLQLVDNRGANLTVVLPDLTASTELSDSDLENIAGGAVKTTQCGVSKVCGVSKGTDPKPEL